MHKNLLTSIFLFLSINSYSQGTWSQIANYGGGAVTEARAFSIGVKGYIIAAPNLWEYDPSTQVWTQMASFSGPSRLSGAAFAIGAKGYFGTGGGLNDFYEYDQLLNVWTARANFGGTGREGALGIAINGKGYIGTGGNYLNDWWEYDAALDAWTQKANLAGAGRYHGGAFSIGNFGYVCTGFNGSFFNDLWQFDPVLNTWTAKANLPGTTRDRPVGLAANGKGYIVGGWTGTIALNDAWEYNPVTDAWVAIANYGGAARYNHCGFVVAGNLYVGTGIAGGTAADVWEYTNACGLQATSAATTCNTSCDGTATVTFPDSNAVVSYSWNTVPAQTTPTATNLCGGNYIVTVTDTAGCTASLAVQITAPAPLLPVVTCTPDTCYGQANGTACAASGYSCYTWSSGSTTQCATGLMAGTYSVIVCDNNGCTGTASGTVLQPPPIIFNMYQTNASCQACADGVAAVNITSGQAPFTVSWSNGGTGNFIQNLLPGWYTCCVVDSNACSVCDSIYVGFTTGLQQVGIAGITVYPNPFNNAVFISMKNAEAAKVNVVDVAGRIMDVQLVTGNEEIKINTASLKAAVYFIEVNTLTEKYRYKLIRQ